MKLAHGQIWWADVEKVRPVLILTRRNVASRLRRVVVAPITTTVRGIRTEVAVGAAEGVREGSVVNVDNIQLLPVEQLLHPAGRLTANRWPEVCDSVAAMMACRSATVRS